jgi:hypothetical protein
MKRLIAILLFVCYLIPCFGCSATVHYCGGKVTSISVLSASQSNCKCGKRPMKHGCCKDKTIIVKASDRQNAAKQNTFSAIKIIKYVPHAFVEYSSCLSIGVDSKTARFTYPPPLQRKVPLFLLNSTLLI